MLKRHQTKPWLGFSGAEKFSIAAVDLTNGGFLSKSNWTESETEWERERTHNGSGYIGVMRIITGRERERCAIFMKQQTFLSSYNNKNQRERETCCIWLFELAKRKSRSSSKGSFSFCCENIIEKYHRSRSKSSNQPMIMMILIYYCRGSIKRVWIKLRRLWYHFEAAFFMWVSECVWIVRKIMRNGAICVCSTRKLWTALWVSEIEKTCASLARFELASIENQRQNWDEDEH